MIVDEATKRNQWIDSLSSISSYGSLLPAQVELLGRVYDTLHDTQRKVAVFVAPPAAGKTHAICLLAASLTKSHTVAIVVPSNYLKKDFVDQLKNIRSKPRNVEVLSIFEFLGRNKEYDYVLVDESHNLKSFIELDPSVVRTVIVTADDNISQDLEAVYLRGGRRFSAQQISYGSAADILALLKGAKHSANLRPILKSPTSWMYFVYAWRNPLTFLLKAVNTDNLHGFKIPHEKLLLFSATPLSNEELSFYCGIEPSLVQRSPPITTPLSLQTSSLYLSTQDLPNTSKRVRIVRKLLRNTRVRTLILVNNTHRVKDLVGRLEKGRLFPVIGPHKRRMKGLQNFMARKAGVLLTSSSIFWEGITIKGVRLLIIFDPPFPRPPLLDLHRKPITNGKADVERRLQQGVGRIARRPEDTGVCILLFSLMKLFPRPGKYFTKRTMFDELPSGIVVQKTVDYFRIPARQSCPITP